MRVTVNLNEYVMVKLTEKGKSILKRRHDNLNQSILARGGTGLGEWKDPSDKEGYYKTQLWILIDVFGKETHLGTEHPYELDIIFPKARPI